MKIKADPDDHAEAGAEAELGQEIAAEPPPGLVHRHGGAMQITRAEESDGAIAQILLLQQRKDGHHQNDARRRHRIQQRLQNALTDVEHGRGRLGYHHRDWVLLLPLRRRTGRSGRRRFGARCGTGELMAKATELRRELIDRSVPQTTDLGLDRRLILRKVPRELRHLCTDRAAKGKDQAEGQHDGENNGQDPSEPYLP